MPETPTTEGSIVAYLRLNDSDWNAKLDAAEQRARDLGRIDPTIRVSADTADAIAKLDAARLAAERVGGNHVTTVTTVNETVNNASGAGQASAAAATDSLSAASKKLEAAQAALARAQAAEEAASRSAANAASSQYLAELRLQDMQDKRGRTDYQLAAAEEAVARATRNADAAEARQVATQAAAASAAEKLAAVEAALGAAQDDTAKKTNNASTAQQANAGYMGVVVAVVAAAIPLLADLTGYAVGVAGAMAGMGAAGVFAVLGIKNALTDGTAAGVGYLQMVQTLQVNLHSLEQTAASGVLGGFQNMLATIDAAMPRLNVELGGFATQLGQIGSSVLTGVINAFNILNPLFMQGGYYVEQLAAGFQRWTEDGGLQKFAAFAEQSLPVVASALGSLVTLATHLVTAFAPMGTVVLQAITVVANALNLIPPQALESLAVGATAAFVAFKAWGMISPILQGVATAVGAVGFATEAATGPIGWIIGAIGLAAAAFTAFTSTTQAATSSTDAFASALQQSNGALDENVRKTVAKQLSDSGALETARQYHIALSTVTDAVLGQPAAMNTLITATQKYGMVTKTTTGAAGQMGETVTELSGQAKNFISNVTGVGSALKASVQAFQDQKAAAEQAYTPIGMQSQAMDQLTNAVKGATAAATQWKQIQDTLNGTAQTVESTTIKLSGDFITAQKNIQAAIKATDKATATSLNVNTEYGNQNHAMILQAVQDAQAKADAIVAAEVKQGASTVKAHNDANAALKSERQSIIDHMAALGLDRAAVTRLVDAELQIDPNITQTFTLKGIESGTQKLSEYLQMVAGIHDITQRITVEATYVGGAQNLATTGGVKAAFADGGTIGGGGTVTGPGSSSSDSIIARLANTEEVISNRFGQADRYRSLLKAVSANAPGPLVAARAYQETGYAPAPAPQTPSRVVNNNMTVYSNNAEQIAQQFIAISNRRAAV